jgi:hypothetical protein
VVVVVVGGGSITGGGAGEVVGVVGGGSNTGGGAAEVVGVVDALVVVGVVEAGEVVTVVDAVRTVDVFLALTALAGAVVVVVGAGAVVVVTGGGNATGTWRSVVVVPPPTTWEVCEGFRAAAADCVVLILGCSSRYATRPTATPTVIRTMTTAATSDLTRRSPGYLRAICRRFSLSLVDTLSGRSTESDCHDEVC